MKHIPSNPREGIFSPTSIEDFRCPRLYFYRKGINLVPKDTNVHLVFGGAWHSALAVYFKEKTHSREEAEKKAIQEFVTQWALANIQGTEKKNREVGILALREYFKFYQNDTAVYDHIEVPASIQMPNGTLLTGVLDRVWKLGNCVMVDDSKTSGWPLTDFFMKAWKNSFQMSAYWYMAETLLGDVTNIRIDATKIPFTGKPQDCFKRQQFDRTDTQMKEWLNTYCRVTDYIMEHIDDPEAMYQQQTQCDSYGGCAYIDVCIHGIKHPNVKLMFETRKEN
jgi:hypothetical protein